MRTYEELNRLPKAIIEALLREERDRLHREERERQAMIAQILFLQTQPDLSGFIAGANSEKKESPVMTVIRFFSRRIGRGKHGQATDQPVLHAGSNGAMELTEPAKLTVSRFAR